ncbi:hypothetical protein, partial [Pygmaiobacter massiliensis]|uniref:hypothetical protein n=1 Tax=Pygmaiobacter massiliensis TaxID=1917873 RepID=UPI00389AC8F1
TARTFYPECYRFSNVDVAPDLLPQRQMADRRNERVYPARKPWHGVVFVLLLTFKKDFIRTAFTLCGFLFVSLFWAFFLWARRFSVFSGSWAVRLSFSGFFALDSTRRDILPPTML